MKPIQRQGPVVVTHEAPMGCQRNFWKHSEHHSAEPAGQDRSLSVDSIEVALEIPPDREQKGTCFSCLGSPDSSSQLCSALLFSSEWRRLSLLHQLRHRHQPSPSPLVLCQPLHQHQQTMKSPLRQPQRGLLVRCPPRHPYQQLTKPSVLRQPRRPHQHAESCRCSQSRSCLSAMPNGCLHPRLAIG
jgi:hypothetical protein